MLKRYSVRESQLIWDIGMSSSVIRGAISDRIFDGMFELADDVRLVAVEYTRSKRRGTVQSRHPIVSSRSLPRCCHAIHVCGSSDDVFEFWPFEGYYLAREES